MSLIIFAPIVCSKYFIKHKILSTVEILNIFVKTFHSKKEKIAPKTLHVQPQISEK